MDAEARSAYILQPLYMPGGRRGGVPVQGQPERT